jgi:hypothetical protein
VVADGDNGRLLPSGSDAATFARAITEAAAPERHRRWREAALATAQRFDRQRCAQRVLEVYGGLHAELHRAATDWHWWDRLLGRIEAEWELIVNRAGSASTSFRREDRDR